MGKFRLLLHLFPFSSLLGPLHFQKLHFSLSISSIFDREVKSILPVKTITSRLNYAPCVSPALLHIGSVVFSSLSCQVFINRRLLPALSSIWMGVDSRGLHTALLLLAPSTSQLQLVPDGTVVHVNNYTSYDCQQQDEDCQACGESCRGAGG